MTGGPYREPGVPTKHFATGQYVRIDNPEHVPTSVGIVICKDALKSGHWIVMSLWGLRNNYSVLAEKMETITPAEYDQLLLDLWLKKE